MQCQKYSEYWRTMYALSSLCDREEACMHVWENLKQRGAYFGYTLDMTSPNINITLPISNKTVFILSPLKAGMHLCSYHWMVSTSKMTSHALIARCKWTCSWLMMPCCSLVYHHLTLDSIIGLYKTSKCALNRTLCPSFQLLSRDVPWAVQTRHCHDALSCALLHRIQCVGRLVNIHFVWYRGWTVWCNVARQPFCNRLLAIPSFQRAHLCHSNGVWKEIPNLLPPIKKCCTSISRSCSNRSKCLLMQGGQMLTTATE